ncbi:MAG: 1-acyl-sn-glycerol-3-phosphate acyltransferase [Bacteroidales bacterium]
MQSTEYIQINVEQVLRDKAPEMAKKIPSFVFSLLRKIICEKQLNSFLEKNRGKEKLAFADALVDDLCSGVEIRGVENIPSEGRFIFASNHPLGGMDGVAILSAFGKLYGDDVKFVVNDILMNVTPLAPLFVPINKHGGQSKDNFDQLHEAMSSNSQMFIFPAGLVSRVNSKGVIEDLEWRKSFITQAVRYKRDIIPIYFEAKNSNFFYKFSYWRKRLGIKFNIDMLFLPRELFNKKSQRFVIHVGNPISYQLIEKDGSPNMWAKKIKKTVYATNYSSSR